MTRRITDAPPVLFRVIYSVPKKVIGNRNVFFRLRYIEMFGTGIRRIISSYSQNIIKPEFKIFENSLIVILPKIEEDSGILSIDERIVYEELSAGIPKYRIEIEDITRLSKDKIIRVLNRLVEKNVIQRTGKGRETKYSRK